VFARHPWRAKKGEGMSITMEHDALIDEWMKARPDYEFVHDGILDESQYWKSEPRIGFLLKEGNDDFANIAPIAIDSEGYGPNGNSKTFWRYMSIWIYAISEIWNGRSGKVENPKNIVKPVNSIAYINIKKHIENRVASEYNDLLRYAKNDKEYLLRQINLINPHIIMCGGTLYLLKEMVELKNIGERIYAYNGRLVIDFYHPSSRKGYETFNELRELLLQKEALDEIEKLKSKTAKALRNN
jgi:hypothetical protein